MPEIGEQQRQRIPDNTSRNGTELPDLPTAIRVYATSATPGETAKGSLADCLNLVCVRQQRQEACTFDGFRQLALLLGETAMLRLGTILPRSETKRCSSLTSL